ncbi:MAG: hypothetical protein EOP61_28715, partial [Sphingomonadales bacterium]
MATEPDSPIVDFVTGDATGLSIPAHGEAMHAAGTQFLTDAFRAFGSLSPGNSVTRIRTLAPCAGGSTGAKLFLSVDYAHDESGLHTELFIKFSRDFTDPRRDWQRHEMEAEVRFAALSRLPGFPISVPTAYFADYHHDSGTGLLITERIAFGEGGIEPHRMKSLDHQTLDEPLPYYRQVITALASLAAAHKAGRLAPDMDERFPFDPAAGSADPVRFDETSLRARLAECADFAKTCPQLMPAEVLTPEFQTRMEQDAVRVLRHEAEIQHYLCGNPDMIALCHWNAHIDNGWFWRDAAGVLHSGLMDWGRVGQITLGSALWGALSAAHHDIWDHHLDELLALFVTVYHDEGGPQVAVEELEFHLALHMAMMGVSRMLPLPAFILRQLPEAVHASGPQDPMFLRVDSAR